MPEENRNVPVTVEGQTRIAYIQINQFVVMLQDGLLMKAHFFDVCEFFQKAAIPRRLAHALCAGRGGRLSEARGRWRMAGPAAAGNGASRRRTSARWTSDNYGVTILIQHRQVPPEVTDLGTCRLRVLQRVTWARERRRYADGPRPDRVFYSRQARYPRRTRCTG
ncbi:MAG: hypothetical protein ACLU3F_15600 [Blautia wexlerae]